MNRLKIALMAGGNSSEREIALQSAAQIHAALDAGKYDVTLIDLNGRSWSHTTADGKRYEVDKNDFSITIGEQKINFEYATVIFEINGGLFLCKMPFNRLTDNLAIIGKKCNFLSPHS